MPIPKDKLDSIFSDPQFRSLPNERKDALLSKIESSYRGSQPRQPEMLPVEKPSLMKGWVRLIRNLLMLFVNR